MAYAELADWENIISAGINGAPFPVMMDAVRSAAIEFCRDTKIDRRFVKELVVDPAHPDTLIPDGEGNEFPGTIMTVWTTEGRIDPISHRQLEFLFPQGYMNLTVADIREVMGWISERPGRVRLFPSPEVETAIDLMVAYQPKRNAVRVPHFLYEMYAHEIGDGALAILHSHDRAPYADPARHRVHRELFEQAKHRFANNSDSGFNRSRRATRMENMR